jgi:DNA-binding CsgD family transcriptional regulator
MRKQVPASGNPTTSSHKDLVPFSNQKPLVPGKGGGLTHWRLQRDKQQLQDQNLDLAKVIRRLSEELIEELIFLRDPNRKTPEAIARRLTQIMGALKRESGALTSMFDIADLHPALQKIFNEKLPSRLDAPAEEDPDKLIDLLPLPEASPEKETKPTLRYLLSNREFEVLALLLAGDKPRQVGAALGINRTSVSNIYFNIRKKARQVTGKEGEPKA